MQDISYICKTGGREYNQDYCMFSQKNGKFCIAVADGLGSYVGSDIASKVAVEYVINWFNHSADDEEVFSKSAVADMIEGAHTAIVEVKKKNPTISSSCTTLSVVISDNVTSVMAHIGDTRIYEIKNGKICFVSKDHSLAQLAVDRGEITSEQIRTHSDQNKLIRVLGSETFLPPEIKTDFFPLHYGDGFVVCTDGMWEYVYNAEIETFFASPSPSFAIVSALDHLHEMRANPTSCDNFTAVVAVKGE